ncbi:ribosome biogenesis protein SLX9-domain-containing protein [Coniochaeta sp. 2T2.1]|nr:ribosome biogenesis protein SLX9-domain-containing protein [Coniochaeta sp. 2T2.1]
MAPTAPPPPKKRPTARQKAQARLADPLLPRKLHRPDNVVSDAFLDNKRDKRLIKHSALLSKIEKSATKKKELKRRRPNKKLVATLESLGDALDDIVVDSREEQQAKEGRVKHKSLKSRPGALKKKERIVKGEMERFGRSLAQLAAVPAGGNGGMEVEETAGEKKEDGEKETQQPASTANRWAALRGFISATMEQNPAFIPATGANSS